MKTYEPDFWAEAAVRRQDIRSLEPVGERYMIAVAGWCGHDVYVTATREQLAPLLWPEEIDR